MKKLIFCLGLLVFMLGSCARYDIETESIRNKARWSQYRDSSSSTYFNQSLNLAYDQINKGQVKTDGEGLYVIIDNENRDNANTIVVGPIPVAGIINLGVVPQNLALALFQSGSYNHRSYYIKGDHYGEDYYEEDYLPPGKYVSFSSIQGRLQGHGWCFEVTAQLYSYKGKKVHGYTVCH